MNLRDSLLAVLVAIVWGVNFVAISWGLEDLSPLLLVALRFVLVCFPAVLFVAPPAAPVRAVVGVGVFMSLGQFALVYTAMELGLSAGLASLVLQAQVLFTLVLAAVLLAERPTAAQWAGVSVGVAGLALVALGRTSATPLLALLVCAAGALSWGYGNVVARRAGVRSGLSMTVWSGVVVPLPLLALAALIDGPGAVAHDLTHLSWRVIGSVAFTAVLASLVGYSIFNALLARHPASSVVPFTLLVPPVGIGAGWVLLAERPGVLEILGGAVLLAGVAVTLLRARPARRPAPAPPSRPASPHAASPGCR